MFIACWLNEWQLGVIDFDIRWLPFSTNEKFFFISFFSFPLQVSKEVWLITSTIARECDFVGSRFKLMLLVDGLIDLLMQNINGRWWWKLDSQLNEAMYDYGSVWLLVNIWHYYPDNDWEMRKYGMLDKRIKSGLNPSNLIQLWWPTQRDTETQTQDTEAKVFIKSLSIYSVTTHQTWRFSRIIIIAMIHCAQLLQASYHFTIARLWATVSKIV